MRCGRLWHNSDLLFGNLTKLIMSGFNLFFLRSSPYFPEGTLFELEDRDHLQLPDRGDGLAANIGRSDTIVCPPFAENVPPGQCPVAITSFAIAGDPQDAKRASVNESIHFQIIEIPLPDLDIESVIVTNRVTSLEADSYWPNQTAVSKYELHISHLRPGFYEASIQNASESLAILTFIKFFPPRFSDIYPTLWEEELRDEAPVKMITVTAYEPDYESELLNKALELATEWGENFRKPIHDRIRVFYPGLADEEIDKLAATAREAESYIYALGERELAGEIREGEMPRLALEKYRWLNKNNVNRLTGIAMYYARK